MEGGQHRQVVGWETGVGAHFSGVGSFRGRSEEGMVEGTHEALRAHPRWGLCKGAQTAHPQCHERNPSALITRVIGTRLPPEAATHTKLAKPSPHFPAPTPLPHEYHGMSSN